MASAMQLMLRIHAAEGVRAAGVLASSVVAGAKGIRQASSSASSSSSSSSASAQVAIAQDVELVDVTVNGVAVQVPKGASAMQACEAAGVDVPRFCYHQRLSVAGNCRMCLVEVEKAPKAVASCAFPVMPNMVIKTGTDKVRKAREGVMEFLLANHPLDCPICDQGGECDLQDQAMKYGSDRGRFTENKRNVVDKSLGPLVKTVMNRCIHCTRCVRFAKEVAGVEDLGVTGRGRDAEIGTYIERLLSSELSANVVDLCPVGALTSKPYAFTARSWELESTESIDVMDAIGSNIRVDARGTEVMRVLPRLNEGINEEWISDKTRYACDGLKRQRLDTPMMKKNGSLVPCTWRDALHAIADQMQNTESEKMMAIAGELSDAESMIALKDLMNRMGCERLAIDGDAPAWDMDLRSSYVLNSTIAGLEEADLCLLVGANPRSEAPILNARLRKCVISNGLRVANIGAAQDLTYDVEHLGTGTKTLKSVADWSHPFSDALKQAKKPMVIVGTGIFERADRDAVLKSVQTIVEKGGVVTDDWNGYNVLHLTAGRVAAMDLGFGCSPDAAAVTGPPKFLFLLGADEVPGKIVSEETFVVYQGHHGDKGACMADVILPGAAYTEKSGTYVNTEGRAQRTYAAVPPCGAAREDWKIIRALSEVAGFQLPYDDIESVRQRLEEVAPHLGRKDQIESTFWLNGEAFKHKPETEMNILPFHQTTQNFYQTNSISRASQTMARCVSAAKTGKYLL